MERTVLICDDDEELCLLLQMVLEEQGYSVRISSGGMNAVGSFREKPPDVFICDIDLPDMSGFDVLQELCRSGDLKKSLVFVMTGRERKEDMLRAEEFGVRGYLVKPFNCAEFLKRLEKSMTTQHAPH